jgi:hypothetical protein
MKVATYSRVSTQHRGQKPEVQLAKHGKLSPTEVQDSITSLPSI